jgi:hypothetical protein
MTKQRQYFEITENNDWEGETWHFFVPLTPNEEQKLRQYVKAGGPAYRMAVEAVALINIEVLMGHEGSTTYYGEFCRCAPLEKPIPDAFDSENDQLYKGGLFKVLEQCLPPVMEMDED